MTQQEIQERNKQIALMLGWKEEQQGSWFKIDKSAKYVVYSEHNNYPHKGLPFHRDWNWLMETIRFIKQIDLSEFNYDVSKMTKVRMNRDAFYNLPITTPIDVTFEMISDFAKPYNENKL